MFLGFERLEDRRVLSSASDDGLAGGLDNGSTLPPDTSSAFVTDSLALAAAQPRELFWDPGHTGGTGSGGNGVWDTTSLNWFDGTTYVAWSNSILDTAIFAGSSGSVTLSSGITTGSVAFNTTGYTISGGVLTLAA